MDVMYRERLNLVKSNYDKRVGAKNAITLNIEKCKAEAITKQDLLDESNIIIDLLKTVSQQAREKASGQLESIVTTALQYISNQFYEFKIEPTEVGGKPACEFYVVSSFNGVISKQRPEDACGGGFVDIICTALRYAYLNVFQDPIINNAILLDEPGKMVSAQASVKFAEFIKELGVTFDRQTIMITHSDDLQNIADTSYVVTQSNGVSKISKTSGTNYDDLEGITI